MKFKFFQSEASGKIYEVFKVNTYNYDGVNYPEMILKDKEGNIIFMMVEEEDGEEYIGLSKKIPKAEIRNIIHQNTLDSILQAGTGITVKVQQKPDGFEKWIFFKIYKNFLYYFVLNKYPQHEHKNTF